MPRILIHGSGGREHALAWRLMREGHQVSVTPGNAALELQKITSDFAASDLEIFSSDQDLVAGRVDAVPAGQLVFGPNRKASQLEGQKLWCKKMLKGLPSAKATVLQSARDIKNLGVLKYNGLAAGKGVYVPDSLKDLKSTAEKWLRERPFGHDDYFVEDYLEGVEASVFLMCNESSVRYMGSAKDYKRRFDQDLGPNTGGMGAISPHPMEDYSWKRRFEAYGETILHNLARENILYRGFMYLGIMWVRDTPYILEINVRLGDPEAQCLLPRLQGDFYQLLSDVARGESIPEIEMSPTYAVSLVGVEKSYPEKNQVPYPQFCAEDALAKSKNCLVFYSGIQRTENSYSASGRVLSVVGMAPNISNAKKEAYEAIKSFPSWSVRQDIGG